MPQSMRASVQRSTGRHGPPASPPGRMNISPAPIRAATPSGSRALRSRAVGSSGPRTTSTMPGTTQSITVTAKATAVDRCPVVQAPSRFRSAATKSRTPSSRLTPAGNIQPNTKTVMVPSRATSGSPMAHQPGKEISTPSWLRMKPSPIRLGGVPIGVASPPSDEAKATQSKSPVAKPRAGGRPDRREASSTAVMIPDTIASIIAVVQVLERKPLASMQTTATAARMRPGCSPTPGSESTAKANRLSSRWSRIPSARMKEPIKRKISGSAKGAKTSRAGATPASTQAAAPRRAVTARGRASVIQRITTASAITASDCAWGERSMTRPGGRQVNGSRIANPPTIPGVLMARSCSGFAAGGRLSSPPPVPFRVGVADVSHKPLLRFPQPPRGSHLSVGGLHGDRHPSACSAGLAWASPRLPRWRLRAALPGSSRRPGLLRDLLATLAGCESRRARGR